jgi:hypothetical protein
MFVKSCCCKCVCRKYSVMNLFYSKQLIFSYYKIKCLLFATLLNLWRQGYEPIQDHRKGAPLYSVPALLKNIILGLKCFWVKILLAYLVVVMRQNKPKCLSLVCYYTTLASDEHSSLFCLFLSAEIEQSYSIDNR